MIVNHDMTIGQEPNGTWVSRCDCGWKSADRSYDVAAIDDWENHADVTLMEAPERYSSKWRP